MNQKEALAFVERHGIVSKPHGALFQISQRRLLPSHLALAIPKLLASIIDGATSRRGERTESHLPIGFEKIFQNCIMI